MLIYIGFSIIRSKTKLDSSTDVDIPIAKVFTTAGIVTWFNPQALIDGTLLHGASKATIPQGLGYVFILGVCIASTLWWLGLTTVVTLFKSKITPKIFNFINIVCGAFIIFYGGSLFYDFIKLAKTVF